MVTPLHTTRRSTQDSLEFNYIRPDSVYFTDLYEKVPYQIGETLDTKIVNYWFAMFIPYLVSKFSSKHDFKSLMLHWLTKTNLGRGMLQDAIKKVDDKNIKKYSTLGKVLREKMNSKLSIIAVGSSWIRSSIPINRFITFKHYLHKDDPFKVMPSGNDIKGFSGSIRNWLKSTNCPYKILVDKDFCTISNGRAFMIDLLRVYTKENLIEDQHIFNKFSWDSRAGIKSTPTVLTVSLAGEFICVKNCQSLTTFKATTELQALRQPMGWKSMQDMLQLSIIGYNGKNYKVTNIVSPDLCALRASVNLNQIKSSVQLAWKFQSIALLLEMVFNGHNYSVLLKQEYDFSVLSMQLIGWKNLFSISDYYHRLPITQSGNTCRLAHPVLLPTDEDEFCRHYWIPQNLFQLISNHLNTDFFLTSGVTLCTCPFCFYSWSLRSFYYMYPELTIWKWKRSDRHWHNCIGYCIKDIGICIAHGINRVMLTILDLMLPDEDDMRYFASLFNTNSPDERFLNKNRIKPYIRQDLLPFFNKLVWTNNGIKVQNSNPQNQASNNGVGATKTEFNQLLFKMTDKIIATMDVWIPIMKTHFHNKRMSDNSIRAQLIRLMQRQQGIREREPLDNDMIELLEAFQEVWKLCKSDRSTWKLWKEYDYIIPRLALSKFHNLISKNIGSCVDGVADYIHIICFHLIELFEKFGLAPTEYQNIDSEALHHTQRVTEQATTLNGGCFHDETEDMLITDIKKLICRLGTDPYLESIYRENKAASYK